MGRITADSIQIEFGILVSKLYTLSIKAAVNDHGFAEYSGLITRSEAEKIAKDRFEKQSLRILLNGGLAFCGFPFSVSVYEENESYTLFVKAVSYTYLLTYRKDSYFYQDANQTFVDVLKKSLNLANVGARIINTKGDCPIKDPILQYCNTPWDFSLRIAGKLTTVITPNITVTLPQICLGIPNGKSYEVSKSKINSTHHLFQKTRHRQKCADIISNGYYTHQFEDEAIFSLGSKISFNRDIMSIISLNYSYQDGVMINTYMLGEDKYFTPNQHTNKTQTGLILNGSIIDVRGEEVKVCLASIPDDAEGGTDKATWFEYAPETNNGMYAVPPTGTAVALSWHSEKDGDIKSINAIGQWNSLDEHTHKYYITEYAKQLHMAPRRLSFLSDSNIVTFEEGLNFDSQKKISIHAKKDIIFRSGKLVQIKTPEQIIAAKSGAESSIVMAAREVDVKSSNTTFSSDTEPSTIKKPRRKGLKKIELSDETVAVLNASTPKF